MIPPREDDSDDEDEAQVEEEEDEHPAPPPPKRQPSLPMPVQIGLPGIVDGAAQSPPGGSRK